MLQAHIRAIGAETQAILRALRQGNTTVPQENIKGLLIEHITLCLNGETNLLLLLRLSQALFHQPAIHLSPSVAEAIQQLSSLADHLKKNTASRGGNESIRDTLNTVGEKLMAEV